jgi:hypothetical protein
MPSTDSAVNQMKNLLKDMESEELSFLSPKILNILPTKSDGKQKFFSPTLFSFQDEGVLSLPGLLKVNFYESC